MESGGHRSGTGSAASGAGGADGALCHACGYQYPNGHPSAKQRRAHRKHCGKPASTAAQEGGAEEPGGKVLFPGEGGGAAGFGGGGDGIGAGASECGGAVPGSAQEAGSAPADVDSAEHSSHDDAGSQVIIDKFVEDNNDIASKIIPETNRTDDGGTLNDVTTATQDSGKVSLPEEGVSSVPASTVTSEQPQDVWVPVLPPEPGYGEGVSPELPVAEVQNSNVVSVASDAIGDEISEQTDDVITEPNGTAVTGVDGMGNTVDKDGTIEEKSVKGNVLDSSCQENLETKVGERHSGTAVEEDASNKNLTAVPIEEIPNDEPEPNQQSSQILTSSLELVPNTEEPVKSSTQVPVGTDDFHLETTDTVKPQEQPDSTSVAEDRQTVLEQTDIFEGEHYPNKDGAIETIASAIGPAVNAEVISVDADNMTKNVSSSDVSMGESIKENVTNNTVVPSQADLVDLSTNSTAHETNMVNSTNDVEEKGQNVKSVADVTTHEINEVHTTELVEDKQLDKENVADSISHETNAVSSTENYRGNEKGTIAEANSCNIPGTSNIEEEKQIEEVITNPVPENTNMTSNIDSVEENKQIDVDVKINRDISVLCTTEAIEEKDTTSDTEAENTTINVEDKKQSEEIGAGDISDGTCMIYSTVNEETMHNEDMTEGPSSHEKVVVNSADNEETMVDPTTQSTDIITAMDSVEERKNDETSADLTPPGINAEHATDNVEEKKDGEPILESTSYKIETVGGTDDVKEKQKNEETTADQISGESNTVQGTHDAEKGLQNNDPATVPVSDKSLVSDKSEVAKKPDAVEGTQQKEEAAAKEISTVQSTDDLQEAGQNEEIADKEVIVDSDRSHVSLKVLLADKNVETKEKKPSTKDRVLSFRRRSSSKDNESLAKPGSPKAGSGQQDWNSPARLPAEKKPKGKKQQWVPFICCPSIH